MLQFIMERNLLLYLITAACLTGVVSQLILSKVYDRLIRDTRNTGDPEGRFLKQLRQRFQYCTHLNDKVGDVRALIQKGMMEYRFWGMSLHSWKRLGVECFAVSMLSAAAGTWMIVRSGGEYIAGNMYFGLGVMAVLVTAAAYGISDTGYRRQNLEIRLTDYLENSGVVRDYTETVDAEETEHVTSIDSPLSSRKARKRSRVETRAQKEKNELKDNLARAKAGMQETAAERERNLDFLRQMDSREQERVLREFLKEVLT